MAGKWEQQTLLHFGSKEKGNKLLPQKFVVMEPWLGQSSRMSIKTWEQSWLLQSSHMSIETCEQGTWAISATPHVWEPET